CTKKEDSLDVW
nr:immunoglobulin heavy chain junction region [Macaca mulatta]MOV44938.1 immunoglobulin heavy chain junction region [Macaca mulatta]MOV45716.1 immunoglobulin heavy chain junction region [Macaca mulatta]MOV46376.1 immunoglobulin heavy chain junction region [Macaca mulatta]MOV87272.1 immunoglobulin heavy chain junction region [Macaca mulatta]